MSFADFSRQALLHDFVKATILHVREASTAKNISFPSYLRLISPFPFRLVIGLRAVEHTYGTSVRFCSSEQMFAAGFLHIPHRYGDPCLRLSLSRY